MNKVWVLNHYAVPPGSVGGTRHFHLAEHLRTYGWEATIISASTEHASGQQRLVPSEATRLERFSGVPFLWLRTSPYRGNGGGRMLNMLSYTWRALMPSTTRLLGRPDVVLGSSVHPFAALAGALLARRHGVPFVFEVRDLWPQTLIDLGRLRERSVVTYAMRLLEKWLYRRAGRVVTLLPRAVDYIAALGVDPDKVVWISNGVNIESFPSFSRVRSTREAAFIVMYFGSHGQANGLEALLKAMAVVKSEKKCPQIRLRLVGDGPLKPQLQEMALSLGLDENWVVFEKAVKKSEIPRMAAEADAFVITVPDRPNLYRYGISPNKLFDYLAGGRPIIIGSAAINNPVEDAQCGITIKPDDPVALADALVTMARTPLSQREVWGQRGRRHVEERYGYDRLAERLAKLLDECVASVVPVPITSMDETRATSDKNND